MSDYVEAKEQKYYDEYNEKDFKDFEHFTLQEDELNLLLFNINNNLKRIADNLEQFNLTFGNYANFIANKR